MKKSLLLTFSLLSAASLCAAVLSPTQALRRLQTTGNPDVAAPALRAVQAAPSLMLTLTDQAAQPAIYLFSAADPAASSPYLIVSADSDALPLLGYGDALPVDDASDLPENMRWWLDEYARQIDWARSHPSIAGDLHLSAPVITDINASASPAPKVDASWAPIAPLLSSSWGQNAPYNNLCPLLSGNRTVTGCVATAMAQVMYYHRWPLTGTGSNSYKWTAGNKTLSMDFASTTFDWANMLPAYGASPSDYTAPQADAVATLMYACGVAANMNYNVASTGGSGTQTFYGRQALVNNMGYDQNAILLDRTKFGLAEWEQMVYSNLQANAPVLYTGATPQMAGHAFVCDGYSSDGFFHFNWGWDAAYNGYFRLTALTPAGFATGGAAGGFNFYQEVIFNIQPEGKSTLESPVNAYIEQQGAIAASMAGADLTIKGDPSNTSNYPLVNFGGKAQTIDIGLRIVSADGGSVNSCVSAYTNRTIGHGSGFDSLPFRLSSLSLPNGQYFINIIVRRSGTSQWFDIGHDLNTYSCRVLVTKSGSSYTASIAPLTLPTVTAYDALTPFYLGKGFKVNATVTYPAEASEWYGGITMALFLADAQGNAVQYGGATTYPALDILGGETRQVTIESEFANVNSKTLSAGTYYMAFFESNTGKQISQFSQINLQATPASPKLYCPSLSITGGATNVDPSAIEFNATINIASGYMADPVDVVIFGQTGDTSVAAVPSSAIFADATSGAKSAQVQVSISLPDAQPGEVYTALVYPSAGNVALKKSRYGTTQQLKFTIGERSGIPGIDADSTNSPAAFFNLQGIPCADPNAPGLYIRRDAAGARKVVVR